MSDPSPQVSVIVVTRNSLPALSDCLRSLPSALGDLVSELIVVDNASTDDSPGEASRLVPSARIIRNDRNTGFAAACNRGAEIARGEYLLFLNPDLVPDAGSVEQLMSVARETPKAGLISGRLRNPDGSFQATCRMYPSVGNMVFARGSALSRLLGGSGGGRYTLGDFDRIAEVPAVAATFVMIRRDLFEDLGRFDSRFFMYMEDTDLSYRLHLHGRVNMFVPAAGGVHRWGEGSREGRLRRLWWHHLSVWRYFLKHWPNGFSVVVLPLLLTANLVLKVLFGARVTKGRTP